MEKSTAELLQMIQSGAPQACGLEDCFCLETAIRKLLEFSWLAVNGTNQVGEADHLEN